MASTKSRTRDRNRFRKQYPLIRRRPVTELISNKEVVIEVADLTFDGTSEIIYHFKEFFPATPTITAISKDVSVNVFITAVSRTQVTIRTSEDTQGSIQLHAVFVG